MTKCVANGKPLEEAIVKDIHRTLMDNILPGGIYRNVDVLISGATHHPPTPDKMQIQVHHFFADLAHRVDLNDIELAAWAHAEFVKIHPFTDGNGRTSRLIMNYHLMANKFLPVSIPQKQRLAYYESLDSYAVDGELVPFADMIAELENAQLNQYIKAIDMQRG